MINPIWPGLITYRDPQSEIQDLVLELVISLAVSPSPLIAFAKVKSFVQGLEGIAAGLRGLGNLAPGLAGIGNALALLGGAD